MRVTLRLSLPIDARLSFPRIDPSTAVRGHEPTSTHTVNIFARHGRRIRRCARHRWR